ncbi:hypothetical protein GWO43_07245 [candidate division KSB1 bacterium]|nr:hypothetical protein [candidate division KSB1 bacterium]NIT70680.1 hypothetical protein [candidate division KSB1 bacterium]NIU24409.1 hypothetical protein [candidate division KSB1 bacterium]NIU94153.1 hypothetical protein [candidate division KSB1 bacterium]NIW18259.1 hypothetical protein [candidate division KSB1 bacterium]
MLVIPLVSWIWIGGVVMIVGTLIAMGPDRFKKKRANLPELKPVRQVKEVEHAI